MQKKKKRFNRLIATTNIRLAFYIAVIYMIVSLAEAFHTCQRYLGHLSYVVLPHVQGSEKK